MPIHTFSRRQFITRSVFGGLAVLTLRQAPAAGVALDRWALFSDPHIAADPAERSRGMNMTDSLRWVVAQVVALEAQPAGLLVNGDLAFDVGSPGDYTQFTELMRPLAEAQMPLHFTLGNHDERDVFWQSLATQAALPRPVAGKQVSILETPTANWFLLDSLERTKQTSGSVGAEQLGWLRQALAARSDKPALVMVHHNPISPDPERKIGLKDGEELLALLVPLAQVKALFFGHTHHWEMSAHQGIHLVNLPAVAYAFEPALPTGWVDCHLCAEGMSLELRANDPAHPQHGQVTDLRWRA